MFNDINSFFLYAKEHDFVLKVIISILWMFAFLILKWSLTRKVSNSKNISKFEKIKFKKNSNSYFYFALAFVLVFIWFSQLQSLLVSLVAVAAALVLATKEIIMCITGGILIRISEQFKHGDRIEVDGIRGFVIQKSFTTTKVLEIGPEINSQQTTGKIVTIPNSLMLNNVVKNESFFGGYSINLFSFPVIEVSLIDDIEVDLIAWAKEISNEYIEEAKKSMHKFSSSEGINIPSLSPRTKLLLNDEGKIEVLLKMVVKNSEVADTEQNLLRRYIKKYKVTSTD